ncbi:MAG: serine/threonine protein kinase, partial [Deltaproteobacteria bacterium]|nr:serine/threonine protein kinase [Deltaproteobacteria bacterium]MBW2536613.1 serine/threonine protein kinase [Deltaproteobacteria bacterium]
MASKAPGSKAGVRRRVGRYELHTELAKGGMATVHLGRVLGAGKFARTVAIKRLHEQYAGDPDFARMFLDEAEIVARVRHPNVVPTLDLIEEGGDLFIVMEFIEGVTLKHLLRTADRNGERVPWNVALTIMDGVLRGLHAAHEARNELGERMGLVHRDVSPDNILVGTDGFARVFDFGIAKALGQAHTTQDGHVKGKVAYMTPEQLLGKVATRRADVFSSAIVLWEALTGRRLFASADVGQSMHRLLHLDVPAPTSVAPHLPEKVDALVLKGLERDPAKRYATAQVMAEAIGDVGGLASLGEVGEWVRDLAGERLKKIAKRVAAMERSAPAKQGAADEGEIEPLPAEPSVGSAEITAGGTPLAIAQETTTPTMLLRTHRKRTAWLAGAAVVVVGVVALAFFGGLLTGGEGAAADGSPTS